MQTVRDLLSRDLSGPIEEVIKLDRHDPETLAIYNDLYQWVYRRMYERLRPLYEEIRQITGYPPRPGQ
jgi:hypothetical protein